MLFDTYKTRFKVKKLRNLFRLSKKNYINHLSKKPYKYAFMCVFKNIVLLF